jgi:hypothetical protein
VRVDTVLSVSDFLSALATGSEADGKGGGDGKKGSGRITRIVPMGPERVIIQPSGSFKMFAVDVQSSRVEQPTRSAHRIGGGGCGAMAAPPTA